MMDYPELIFDILDDLSDELGLIDLYQFMLIEELTYELSYKMIRKVEYYHEVFEYVRIHERCCYRENTCRCIIPTRMTDYVCFVGDINVLKWIYFNKRDYFGCSAFENRRNDGMMTFSSAGGHFEIIKWLHNNVTTRRWPTRAIEFACGNGYIEIAKWLKENQYVPKFEEDMIIWPARYGYIEVLDWIKNEYPSNYCPAEAIIMASYNGYLDVIKWIHKNYPKVGCPSFAVTSASENGHLQIVKWICQHYQGIEIYKDALERAVENNHLEVVEWLTEKLMNNPL